MVAHDQVGERQGRGGPLGRTHRYGRRVPRADQTGLRGRPLNQIGWGPARSHRRIRSRASVLSISNVDLVAFAFGAFNLLRWPLLRWLMSLVRTCRRLMAMCEFVSSRGQSRRAPGAASTVSFGPTRTHAIQQAPHADFELHTFRNGLVPSPAIPGALSGPSQPLDLRRPGRGIWLGQKAFHRLQKYRPRRLAWDRYVVLCL